MRIAVLMLLFLQLAIGQDQAIVIHIPTVAAGQSGAIAMGADTSYQATADAASHTTAGITTQTTGSTFVVMVTLGNVGDYMNASHLTDNKGNSYTILDSITYSTYWRAYTFYKQNGAGGAGHTFTASSGISDKHNIFVCEIKGAALTNVLDKHPAPNNDVASPFVSDLTGTTSQATEMLIGFVITDTPSGTETVTWGNSFTQLEGQGNSSYMTGAMGYRKVTSAGSYQLSNTSSVAVGMSLFIISFVSL